nr:hypothetical protein [Actinomadura sp. BRA 177]
MMVIVSVLWQTSVFEYVTIWAAKRARHAPAPCVRKFATSGAGW